jgi:hypothetical protein
MVVGTIHGRTREVSSAAPSFLPASEVFTELVRAANDASNSWSSSSRLTMKYNRARSGRRLTARATTAPVTRSGSETRAGDMNVRKHAHRHHAQTEAHDETSGYVADTLAANRADGGRVGEQPVLLEDKAEGKHEVKQQRTT